VTEASAEGAFDPALTAKLREAVRKWKFHVPDRSNAAKYPATLDLTYGNPPPARIPQSRAGEVRAEPKNAEEAYREGVRLIRAQSPEPAVPLLTRSIQEKQEWEASCAGCAQAYFNLNHQHEADYEVRGSICWNGN